MEHWKTAATTALPLVLGGALAQAPETDSALNESVQSIRKPGLFNIELETTVYKLDGDGPFPVVVINHGKASGDPRFQGRYRPAQPARYFLQRGYAVAAGLLEVGRQLPLGQGWRRPAAPRPVQLQSKRPGRVPPVFGRLGGALRWTAFPL